MSTFLFFYYLSFNKIYLLCKRKISLNGSRQLSIIHFSFTTQPHTLKKIFYLFLERQRKGGRKTLMRERNVNQLLLICTPTVDRTHHPGLCAEPVVLCFAEWRHLTYWAARVRASATHFQYRDNFVRYQHYSNSLQAQVLSLTFMVPLISAFKIIVGNKQWYYCSYKAEEIERVFSILPFQMQIISLTLRNSPFGSVVFLAPPSFPFKEDINVIKYH